jgi:hypothetical protein
LQGVYFGMDFDGEKSPYFTATKVSSLALNGDVLSFEIPPRKLFGERPASLAEAEAMRGPGFTGSELKMKGRLNKNALVLACSAVHTVCPESEMKLYKSVGVIP